MIASGVIAGICQHSPARYLVEKRMHRRGRFLLVKFEEAEEQALNPGRKQMTDIDKDTEIQLLKAEIAKGIRREIMLSDVIHNHVTAMRAAVVAGHLESPDRGLQWIYNTLRGPGHLPDIDEALAMGGAQAMFDAEAQSTRLFGLHIPLGA